MATYVERLKQANPQGFEELSKLLSYTANEQYGGVPQDWQAQIFTPLDTSNVPKAIPFAKPNQYLIREQDSDGNVIREEVTTDPNAGGQLLRYGQTPAGYEPVYTVNPDGEGESRTGYKKSIGDVNGIPVTALYGLNGELKGFDDESNKQTWLANNQSVSGKWDASGKPQLETFTRREGGLIGSIASDSLLGPIANIGAAYFGGPLGSAAWQLAQGNDLGDAAKAAALTYAAQQIGGTETDPNAVGGVYGPDNIDVGGGWSPATGAGSSVTAGAITNDIAGDNIDAGGGWSPATGATEAELASARAALAATPTEVAAAKAAGMTVSDYLNYARAGILVNALTGDPLGLSGDGGQQSPAGQTGFAQVPIPAEWKSPTYAASSAPIDLSTIFSNQNMLGGTQWQGLPSQQNMSFNDIFAAGQQQTPMGTPVDINQIVSSILGQTATSQKLA
jgi:hypothetical protein